MDKKEKEEFMKQKRAAYKKARTFGLFLFIVVMAFCCILGLMIPVRPKESVLEKKRVGKVSANYCFRCVRWKLLF